MGGPLRRLPGRDLQPPDRFPARLGHPAVSPGLQRLRPADDAPRATALARGTRSKWPTMSCSPKCRCPALATIATGRNLPRPRCRLRPWPHGSRLSASASSRSPTAGRSSGRRRPTTPSSCTSRTPAATRPDGIAFQHDHQPQVPTSRWQPGIVEDGPYTLEVPPQCDGPAEIGVGWLRNGQRVALAGGGPRWIPLRRGDPRDVPAGHRVPALPRRRLVPSSGHAATVAGAQTSAPSTGSSRIPGRSSAR